MSKVILGNNLNVMLEMDSQSIDLIYMDPPFFKQKNFIDFDDRWPSREDYLGFMAERLDECKRLLKDTGSIYVHCDHSISHHMRLLLDDVFGEKQFKNEIIWHHPNAGMVKYNFPNKHDVILRYTVGNTWVFNMNDIRIPYKQSSIKRAQYKGTMLRNKADIVHEIGKVPDTVWEIAHVKNREGMLYSTQKPIKLLERIIKASSNKGDVVLDPFMGSGTTLVAAKRLERNYIGIDKNPDAVKITNKRLNEILL